MVGNPSLPRLRKGIGSTLLGTCVLLFAAGMLALTTPASASQAWGSINNFDTVNDTGSECHGFEIEIDGAHSTDISYTYDWNHYGTPTITEDNSNPLVPKVFVRYKSARNPDGTWAAYTAIPSGPINPTMGHQFTNPSVNFGGEHFGVGYYGTPIAVKYSWLKDDGAGNLVFAGAVNISTPSFTVNPPAQGAPAQVVAAIVPPPPPLPPPLQFGPACWVKETKTQSHNNGVVELRDLVSDDPNDANFKSWRNGEPDQVEVEWQVIQTDFNAPDGGVKGNMAGAPEDLPNGDEVITRRYDFFEYVGPFDAESGEAMATVVGQPDPDGVHYFGNETVTYNDHIDPNTGEWVTVTKDLTKVWVVGAYKGAQMAGYDAAAKIGLIDHLQDGEVNVAYPNRSMVIGGTPPIATTLTGSLPPGMSFDAVSGVLSGTPTATGTFSFSLHSTDANNGDVTTKYLLTIVAAGVQRPPHMQLTTTASPAAAGSTSGDGEYATGANVTASATANAGYAFANWTDGGAIVSTSPSYTFTADVNRELVANFVPAQATRPTTLTMSAAKGQVGKKVTLSAILRDKATKVVLPGKSVQFALDGANIGPLVTTNTLGKATYAFIVPEEMPLGLHPTSATFAGDASYSPVTATGTLGVAKGYVKLTVPTVTGHAGGSVILVAKITNSSNIPMVGETLYFSVSGIAVGSAITDATGKAYLPYAIPVGTVAGSYAISVTFNEDEDHFGATKVGWLQVK